MEENDDSRDSEYLVGENFQKSKSLIFGSQISFNQNNGGKYGLNKSNTDFIEVKVLDESKSISFFKKNSMKIDLNTKRISCR